VADVLLSEYRAKLESAGALFCCDPQPTPNPDGRQWTAPLGGMRASISLRGVESQDTLWLCMEPQVQATGTVACDGPMAAVVLADAQATLQRALSCLAVLYGLRVWIKDCPCSRCSSRGTVSGRTCETCAGTGKRQEAEEVSCG
jgi:hypothetical protein